MATFDELCVFHSSEYLNFLQHLSSQEDTEKYDDDAQAFGLSKLTRLSLTYTKGNPGLY